MTKFFIISNNEAAATRVEMIQTAAGSYIVRDDANTKGGLFNTSKSALRFIRDEFGVDTEVTSYNSSDIAMAA